MWYYCITVSICPCHVFRRSKSFHCDTGAIHSTGRYQEVSWLAVGMSTLAAPSRLVPRWCTGGQGQIMHGSQPSFCFNDMKDRSLKQIYIDLHWFRSRLIYIVVWVYMFVFHIISCHSIRFGYEAQDDVMIGNQVYWRTFFDSKALKGSKVQLWSSVRWNGMSIECIKLYTRIYIICIFTLHTYNAHVFYQVKHCQSKILQVPSHRCLSLNLMSTWRW